MSVPCDRVISQFIVDDLLPADRKRVEKRMRFRLKDEILEIPAKKAMQLVGRIGKKRSPLTLAVWGLQPKPYHNAGKEMPAYNETKIIINSLNELVGCRIDEYLPEVYI